MEQTAGKFRSVITSVISKYGKNVPRCDHADLRQEAEMALMEAGDISDRLAYRIAQRRIIDYLRKQPPRMEDIDDPGTRKKYEHKTVHFPDYNRKLDGEKAIQSMASLPEPLRSIIYGSFVEGDTDKKLAEMFG